MLESGRGIRLLAAAIAVFIAVALFDRLRYGIDFTDEAFYVALPFRFALGDRPFVDELNVTQTAGLLLYPFVKAYLWVAPSATGIVLFVRILFLAFLAAVGWSAYRLAQTRVPSAAALLVGAACLCFIPYGIPSLSYNTLSGGLLTIGLCLAARALLAREVADASVARDRFFWAGVVHGAAALAYPSVVISTLPTAVAIFFLADERRVRSVGRYVLGGVVFAAFVSPVFLQAGGARLRRVVTYSSQAISNDPNHAKILLERFLAQHPQLWSSLAIIAVAIILARRRPLLVGLALPLIPLLARGSVGAPIVENMNYLSCFALFAPVFALGVRDRRPARVLLFGVWLPPFFAAVAMSWSSGNGVAASGIGLYPAAIASAILLTIWISDTAKRWPSRWLRVAVTLAPAVFAFQALQSSVGERAFYRDSARSELTARVTEGPFKGLRTTRQRKEWLAAVTEDIRVHAHGDRALFFYDFPAGYLLARKRPLVSSAWIFPIVDRSVDDTAFFRERAGSGNLVFHMDGPRAARGLDEAILERTELIGRRSGYTLRVVR